MLCLWRSERASVQAGPEKGQDRAGIALGPQPRQRSTTHRGKTLGQQRAEGGIVFCLGGTHHENDSIDFRCANGFGSNGRG
jgi:hypothetical protein